MIQASPFSLKWKRDEGITPSSPSTPNTPEDGSEDKAQTQLPSLTKELKNGAPATPKIHRSGSLMVAVSSPKIIHKQSSKMTPKVGTKLGQSPLNGSSKIGSNSSSIPTQTGSESRLVRPRLGSSSTRSSSQDSLSQSNESLKILALDNMVRSNSFTHFKQIPSPTSEPMTRSFSFNRAVELAKPLANTQLRPPRSSFIKPPQLNNGRVGSGLHGSLGGSGCLGGFGGLQSNKTLPAASFLPCPLITPAPTTPRALRKPLLPSSMLTKSMATSGGSLCYKIPRTGQVKQQKPLLPGTVKEDISSSPAFDFGELLDIESMCKAEKVDSHSDSDGSSGDAEGKDGQSSGLGQSQAGQTGGETLEDMSLSSASSLERGDTSEEFLDDFDSVGDIFSDGDLPDNRKTGSNTHLHSLVNEASDWDSVDMTGKNHSIESKYKQIQVLFFLAIIQHYVYRVSGHKEESPMQDSQGLLVLSPEQTDAPQISSVELSPSNSSGGTYMWDEEGLGPLGGPEARRVDSYDDSELNSMVSPRFHL